MNIISVDLPWEPETAGHRTLAITDLDGNFKIEQASDDDGLLKSVRKNAEPGSVILLDIPIEGCNKLNDKHFRPVDSALQHCGISLLPSSKAERGKGLKEELERRNNRIAVYEIYPYAIYKFLACLKKKDALGLLNGSPTQCLLDERFRRFWPPRYKRAAGEERQQAIRFLYSLLTDPTIRLSGLDRPGSLSLARLGDEYDACLGAVVGLYWVKGSNYACLAGTPEEGEILLLADRWLRTALEKKEIQVRNNEKRG